MSILNLCTSCVIAGFSSDNDTEINITNEIISIPGENQVQMLYTIKTPRIIHYDFVLALDSSGSFGEKSTQTKAVLHDIPKFLNNLSQYYEGAIFNITIVSWDDNIDFSYDKEIGFTSLDKNEPLVSKLAPIENVTKDLYKLPRLYKNKQTERTDFSVPIKASLDVFNNPENNPRDPLHTRQFIVLVTGDGEYKPAPSDLLKEARDKKIGIYTVGLDIGGESELHGYLEEISKNSIKAIPSGSNRASDSEFIDTAFYSELNATIEKALRAHFDKIMNKSVADNIELIDRFYCYNQPNINSLRVDTKSNSIKRSQTAQSIIDSKPLSDGTTEVAIEIFELLPNSTTTVAFNVENTFNPMTLPTTVAERKDPFIICSPKERADPMLRYTWQSNMQEIVLPLGTASRDRLSIMSAKNKDLNETLKTDNLGLINTLRFLFWGGI
jgi:hypothetical protein